MCATFPHHLNPPTPRQHGNPSPSTAHPSQPWPISSIPSAASRSLAPPTTSSNSLTTPTLTVNLIHIYATLLTNHPLPLRQAENRRHERQSDPPCIAVEHRAALHLQQQPPQRKRHSSRHRLPVQPRPAHGTSDSIPRRKTDSHSASDSASPHPPSWDIQHDLSTTTTYATATSTLHLPWFVRTHHLQATRSVISPATPADQPPTPHAMAKLVYRPHALTPSYTPPPPSSSSDAANTGSVESP